MAGRSYFFSSFTVIALAFGLTTVADPGAVAALVISFGKALLMIAVLIAFMWFLVAIAWLAHIKDKG